MKQELKLRSAISGDAAFIAETIMGAEKSQSDKLSLCTVFNLDEEKIHSLILKMLDEEIDGCEFSLSSFLILESGGRPVAAIGGWIEGLTDEMPSRILKSNLIAYTFPKESLQFARTKSDIISGIQIDRENMALQIEYVYISPDFRNKKLGDLLLQEHFRKARQTCPALKKAQVQVFKNNTAAIKLYERNGFTISKSFVTSHPDALTYLPFSEKLLMEKTI